MIFDYFKSFDNYEFAYRLWNFNKNNKSIIVIHRGHEHSERLNDFATDKRFLNFNIFSFDLRGHGYTKAKSSPYSMDYVRDLEHFKNFICEKYDIKEEDIFIIANSIGGVIVSEWLHSFSPNIVGTALLAPAFQIKLYVPFAKESLRFLTKIFKNLKVISYVKPKVLTHDKIEQEKYKSDKLINKEINAHLLVDLADMGEKLVANSNAIEYPTLILSAQKDYVVENKAQKNFFIGLPSQNKKFIELKNFYHGILFEKEREEVYSILFNFITECFNQKKQNIDISARTFSTKEYDKLRLNMISLPYKLLYSAQKTALKYLGFLSNGMNLGLKYGFDSGISLDYIYKNKAGGKFFIGKILDRFYLNQIGWKGIRERKTNLLKLLRKAIHNINKEKINILDIAGGTGNYLFDIKREFPNTNILINEFKKTNIDLGEKIIQENNWEDIDFVNYDCFDGETFKKINFIPDIIVISGIFELFSDNTMLLNSIKGLAEISENNTYLIYTGQPWHPQLAQIAFVLNSHKDEEESWIMRRRSQRELDSLFRANKFIKKEMLIDNSGIFTVSLAKLEK
ncbi:alpha/beta fold hydrolase [Fusobacterium russii]|uniref:alpha/beta fold hydrolase n=1 Tax=Fusobacterium russii TaxID=854 RepID=UPI00039D95F1|nr:alpha/beta fold hydrolase [Fusobacterium russii]